MTTFINLDIGFCNVIVIKQRIQHRLLLFINVNKDLFCHNIEASLFTNYIAKNK